MGHSQSRHTHVTSRNFEPRSHSSTGPLPDVPLAVVEEILLNLPEHQVVRVCRLVCREWKELVDSAAHWRERCRREGIQPCDASSTPKDWRLFYFLTKKRRNLIKNPSAEDKFSGWKIVQNGGDCWTIGDNSVEIPNHRVPKCFVTSYMLCLKQQLIDLTKEGYSAAFMDQLQPHIKISDWCGPRWDCGCEYQICVELLDQKKKPISKFEPEQVFFPQWNDQQWCEITHVLKDYGRGVRFIRFTHGGKDTKYWAGHYGIRSTGQLPDVPLAVVEEILPNLPEHQVVRVCRLVCREWKELVDSAAHWRERCRREGIQPCDASRTPEDWRLFYFLTKKRRNLLKNPSAEEKFSGWKIVQNGGDCWTIEDNSLEIPNHTVPKCFVTSYWLCLKQQLIDLKKEGYSAAFMDQQQPHIKISDWCGPRWDCGSEYQICVELLDRKEETHQ